MLWYRHIEEPQDMGRLYTRAKCFSLGENTQYSTEFGKCIVNFTRGKGNAGKTIQQVCDGRKAKVNFGGDEQLSLF